MKVSVYTLGCKVNTYESEYIISKFKEKNYEIVDFKDDTADIYIINTCTVTNTSDQKSRKMIRRAKNKNKDAIIVAMGCFTQIRENDNSIMDYIDIVIGNSNKSKIVDIIEDYIKNKKKIIDIKNINEASFDDMELSVFNTRTRALIKIEDGCENFCSYCIIPYVRGRVRSKDPKKVIKEAEKLVKNGYKEIVLTGIHTGHYGSDLDNYDFSDLLSDLELIDGLERIRISSIEITELNDKFIKTLEKSKKIVNHIHIPLQAGSDKILKLMNRKYDTKYFLDKINKIRNVRPNMAFTTDVIVGFPSEEEQDFNDTISFVKKVNFAGGHVFPFSKRNGTVAAKMTNQLTNEEKHNRSKKLIEVFENLEEEYYKSFIGKTATVLVETSKDNLLTGHTDNYLKVSFNSTDNLINKFVSVKLTEYNNGILFGEKI